MSILGSWGRYNVWNGDSINNVWSGITGTTGNETIALNARPMGGWALLDLGAGFDTVKLNNATQTNNINGGMDWVLYTAGVDRVIAGSGVGSGSVELWMTNNATFSTDGTVRSVHGTGGSQNVTFDSGLLGDDRWAHSTWGWYNNSGWSYRYGTTVGALTATDNHIESVVTVDLGAGYDTVTLTDNVRRISDEWAHFGHWHGYSYDIHAWTLYTNAGGGLSAYNNFKNYTINFSNVEAIYAETKAFDSSATPAITTYTVGSAQALRGSLDIYSVIVSPDGITVDTSSAQSSTTVTLPNAQATTVSNVGETIFTVTHHASSSYYDGLSVSLYGSSINSVTTSSLTIAPLYVFVGSNAGVSHTGSNSIHEVMYGGSGVDVFATGTGIGVNYLFGGAGNDRLSANNPGDNLWGGEGDDNLYGAGSAGAAANFIDFSGTNIYHSSGYDALYFSGSAAGSYINYITGYGLSTDTLVLESGSTSNGGSNVTGGVQVSYQYVNNYTKGSTYTVDINSKDVINFYGGDQSTTYWHDNGTWFLHDIWTGRSFYSGPSAISTVQLTNSNDVFSWIYGGYQDYRWDGGHNYYTFWRPSDPGPNDGSGAISDITLSGTGAVGYKGYFTFYNNGYTSIFYANDASNNGRISAAELTYVGQYSGFASISQYAFGQLQNGTIQSEANATVTAPPLPVGPVVLAPSDDSGISTTDALTNQTAGLTISAAVSISDTANVRVYEWIDDNSDGQIDAGELSSVVSVTGAIITGGVFSANLPTRAEGSYNYVMTQTTVGGESVTDAALALRLVVDNSAPTVAASYAFLDQAATDRNTDLITNIATPSVHFTYTGTLDITESYEYSIDGGTSWTTLNRATTTGDTSAGFVNTTDHTIAVGLSFTADSNTTVLLRATDAAGNSTGQVSTTVTYDHTAPNAPSVALVADTGLSTSDLVTNDGRISVTGMESVGWWEYSTDGGTNWITGGTSNSTTGQITLAAGIYSDVKVRAYDHAGNAVMTDLGAVTVDTVAPVESGVTQTALLGGQVAVDSDSAGTVYIVPAGTAANFSSIVAAADGTTGVSGSITAGPSATFTLPAGMTSTSANGYKVYVIDAAGNISAPALLTLTSDNLAPTYSESNTFDSNGMGYFAYSFSDSGSGINSIVVNSAQVQVRFQGNTTGGTNNDGWYDEFMDGYQLIGNELRLYPRGFDSITPANSGPVYDTWNGLDHRVVWDITVTDNATNVLVLNTSSEFDGGSVGYFNGTWDPIDINDYLMGQAPNPIYI